MAVNKIFWQNPYLIELNTKINSVVENKITLEETIIFSFSGGQQSDSGTIAGYEVIESKWEDNEIYYVVSDGHNLKAGDKVKLAIDWNKRYRLMKLHFAAEIILELMNQLHGNPEKVGANITVEKARIDFVWAGSIAGLLPELERRASEIITSDLEIISEFSDRDNEIRYWKIEGFGKVNCGGTHPKRTGEIGGIRLKRNNIGKGRERIEIYLAE